MNIKQKKQYLFSALFPDLVPPPVIEGKKGDTPLVGKDFPIPKNGKDYVLTEKDKEEIAKKVEVPIVEKVIEKTEVIVKEQPIITNKIVKETTVDKTQTAEEMADKINTLSNVIETKVIKDYQSVEDIFKFVLKELKTGKNRLGVKDILNMPQRNPLDQRWHGSGVPGISAGTNITLTTNSDGTITISSTASGTTLTFETPVGSVDDSNTSYTVTHEPVFISVNGAVYTVGTGLYASYVAGTINLTNPIGTGGFIKSFYNA